MAGDTSGNGIYYRSNNGIDSNKSMLEEITAPGFGHGSYQISFVRPSGKSFIKWNTAADGSGTDYFPGDNVEQLLGSGTDLYAIWGDIPLIVQKSSIEDIADTVRSKKTAWLSADIGLTELNTKIDSMVPLDAVPNNIWLNFPSTSAWVNGAQLSTTENKLNITNYANGPLIVFIKLGDTTTASYSNSTYIFLYKYNATTWQYLAQGYGSNITLILGETTTNQRTYITIKTGSGTKYVLNTVYFYLKTT